ncbi:hypothetical protein CN177_02850 [Sinorhizobium meliloti]|nr:hypothetical protein CDO25_21595 [Sinorhizobium meliloti]RVG87377.1 hypothetical protein CN219_07310 [Sinorhizobium meliloti]RVI39492.1 hypothetical protein CN197_00765 [Sinorhizobium meliloti]RVI49257.1 hypothetical protein CN196_01590 [Sinorhizobium meliloti]RVJ30430.1 hypothetical protein CN177_02850 [Sinorhizobium meliloti]
MLRWIEEGDRSQGSSLRRFRSVLKTSRNVSRGTALSPARFRVNSAWDSRGGSRMCHACALYWRRRRFAHGF